MLELTIEKDTSFEGTETITIIQGNGTADFVYEVVGFKYNQKPVTKKTSCSESRLIFEAFEALNFTEIFKESGVFFGCDGWTLKCTLRICSNILSVSLWCPAKDTSKPETKKLLEACEMVYNII